jgi:hypothetical protein
MFEVARKGPIYKQMPPRGHRLTMEGSTKKDKCTWGGEATINPNARGGFHRVAALVPEMGSKA